MLFGALIQQITKIVLECRECKDGGDKNGPARPDEYCYLLFSLVHTSCGLLSLFFHFLFIIKQYIIIILLLNDLIIIFIMDSFIYTFSENYSTPPVNSFFCVSSFKISIFYKLFLLY